MRVQVRLLAGRTLLLDVEATHYVAALKREICEREGASAKQIIQALRLSGATDLAGWV